MCDTARQGLSCDALGTFSWLFRYRVRGGRCGCDLARGVANVAISELIVRNRQAQVSAGVSPARRHQKKMVSKFAH
jgi:hypothetical protein